MSISEKTKLDAQTTRLGANHPVNNQTSICVTDAGINQNGYKESETRKLIIKYII